MAIRIHGCTLALIPVLLGAGAVRADAAPMEARLQAPQLRGIERALNGLDLGFGQDEASAEGPLCFDSIGIRNMTVLTKISDLSITPNPEAGRIDLSVTFPKVEIRGQMFAEGSFPCFDLEEQLAPLTITDLHVEGGLTLTADANGKLVLGLAPGPIATVGSLAVEGSSTVAELIVDSGFVQDMLPATADFAMRQGLAMASDMLEARRTGTLLGIPYRGAFTAPVIETGGLRIGASLDFDTSGPAASCLPAGAVRPAAVTSFSGVPPLASDLAVESGLTVAAAPELIGSAVEAAWWAGVLCGDLALAPPALLSDFVERMTGGAADGLALRYAAGSAPRATVIGDRLRVELDDARLDAVTTAAGSLMGVRAKIAVEGWMRPDPVTRLMLVTIDVAELEVLSLDSRLHDDREGLDELKLYLEEEFPRQVLEGARDLPVADTMLRDTLGRLVVDLLKTDRGVVAALTVFGFSDPMVDGAAPDTTVGTPREAGWGEMEVELGATDDRNGPIVWSWRLDARPWTAWSADATARVRVSPGAHTIEVMARDAWGNVDASPATVSFVVADERTLGGCACAIGTASRTGRVPAFVLLGTVFGFVAIAMRRERAGKAGAAGPGRGLVLVPLLLLLLLPAPSHAQETGVLPQGRFRLGASFVTWLQNPPSTSTGASVAVPTGLFPLGVDAQARERHHVRAEVALPSLSYGITDAVTVAVFLPVVLRAQVDVRSFEVRSLGVDVTPEAQAALREAGFRSPRGGNGDPISDWKGSGIGDVVTGVRWRIHKDRRNAYALSGGVKLPTGRQDDPRLLTDFGFGDGQVDVSADGSLEHRLSRGVVGGTAGYRLRLPGRHAVRPVGGPTVSMMRDPGDVLRAGVGARTLPGAVPLAGSFAVEHHLRDSVSAQTMSPKTDQQGTAYVIGASAGVSSIDAFRRRRAIAPAGFTVGVTRAISANPRLESWQFEARLDLFM